MADQTLSRGWVGGLSVLFFVGLSIFAVKEMHLSPRSSAASQAGQDMSKSFILSRNKVPTLRKFYIGIPQLDAGLSVLVAAFLPGVAGWSESFQVQQIYFLISFFPVLCTWSIDAGRKRNLKGFAYWTSIWALFYQTVGGAVVVPLYYVAYLLESSSNSYWSPASSQISTPYVKALLPSLLIGFLLPTIAMYIPFEDPGLHIHQGLVAFWQPSPWWVNALIFVIMSTSSDEATTTLKTKSRSSDNLRYLDQVYIVSFLISAITHVSIVYMCLSPSYPNLSIWNTLIRLEIVEPLTSTQSLHHIFQADCLLLFTATLVGAYIWLWDLKRLGKTDLSLANTAALMMLGTICVGPGATVAGASYAREHIMARKEKR